MGARAIPIACVVLVSALALTTCSSDDGVAIKRPGTTIVGAPGSAPPKPDGAATAPLPVPARYRSKDGTLHLKVKTEQVPSTVNGVSYNDIYTYTTSVVDDAGTYTPGNASAYIAPEWDVQQGDRLVIDYINAMPDGSFQDVGDPAPSPVPTPLSLHTHGLNVSPAGNSDNVLLGIPQGRSNRFVVDIPKTQYHGLYWYHPHIHGLADDQIYGGLAGNIVVGRADGDYRELDGLPQIPMLVRYNYVQPNPKGEPVPNKLVPLKVASFDGAAGGFTGGVTVATGYPYAARGGNASIIATTMTGPPQLSTFDADGTAHDHGGVSSSERRLPIDGRSVSSM